MADSYLSYKNLLIIAALLIGSFIVTTILFYGIILLFPEWALSTWGKIIIQAAQSVIIFGATPLAGIKITERINPIEAMALNKPIGCRKCFIILLFAVTALPGISWMTEFNSNLNLPSFLAGLEALMKQMEEAAMQLTEEFINTNSPIRLIVNIFVMALIPAICEEMMFRGWLQRVLTKHINYHSAIWVAAFIFSAIHMQFYGFLPRMIIGAGLGYIYYYTGTLWGPILAHFTNNAIAVITGYISYNQLSSVDFDSIGRGDMYPIALASVIVAATLIFLLKDKEISK